VLACDKHKVDFRIWQYGLVYPAQDIVPWRVLLAQKVATGHITTTTTQKVETNLTYLLLMATNTVITSLWQMKQTSVYLYRFSFLNQISFCYQSFRQLTVTSLSSAVRVMQMKVIKSQCGWITQTVSEKPIYLLSIHTGKITASCGHNVVTQVRLYSYKDFLLRPSCLHLFLCWQWRTTK
jgi:hypothetical protein